MRQEDLEDIRARDDVEYWGNRLRNVSTGTLEAIVERRKLEALAFREEQKYAGRPPKD